jgi:hypothetical protein
VLQFRRVKFAPTAVALAAALLAAGCGGGSSKSGAPPAASTPAPATSAPPAATTAPAPAPSAGPRNTCLDVPASLERTLQAHIVLAGGRVSHLQAVTTKAFPTYYFVSARIDGAGTKPLLATWVAKGLTGDGSVYSVDATAALVSLYGGAIGKNADLTVDAPGAYKSRVCVAGAGAPRGSNAPAGGGKIAPAGQ